MNESYEFRDKTHFTAGATGKPGERIFYIQMGDLFDFISLKAEKQQVIALAGFLENLLSDMPHEEIQPYEAEIKSPSEPVWTAGQIAVGVDLHNQMMVVSIAEFQGFEESVEISNPSSLQDFIESDGANARVFISQAQALDFISKTNELVSNSRPPCRLCGQPKNPDLHACPRLN